MGSSRELLLGFNLVFEVYFGPNLYNFCKNGSFTDIVFRVSCLFRLPVKSRLPPYFPSWSS